MTKLYPRLRINPDAIDNPKVQLLCPADRWHFIALLCCQAQGLLDRDNQPLVRRMVAVKMEISPSDLEALLARLERAGIVSEGSMTPISCGVIVGRDEIRLPQSEWAEIRDRVFHRDDFTCTYCGARGGRLECDHIFPLSRGGGNELSNLTTACFKCNRSKSDRTLDEWRASHE